MARIVEDGAKAPPELPGLGQSDALRQLADDLWKFQDAEADWREFQRWCRMAILHLRAGATRVERKHLALSAATAAAEQRVASGLASAQTEALGDGTAFNPHGCFVYCLWGKDRDRPLYVGCSTNVLSRLGTHLGNSLKRKHVVALTITRLSTNKRMLMAEQRLIAHYLPPWNTRGCEGRGA